MARAFAEIAFTPAVRSMQDYRGSAKMYDRFLAPEAARGDRLTGAEAGFIARRDGFYQATVSETGWPYVQFRGGPRGFLRVLNDKTLGYADFRGNRQYLSTGNLAGDDRISLILMDYPNQRRLKLWGRARLIGQDEDPGLVASLLADGCHARPERAVVITLEVFDWNCPQHIPQRLTAAEMMPVIAPMKAEIEALKAENEVLKARLDDPS